MAKGRVSGSKGQKPITFNKGGMHRTTHTPAGKPISPTKMHEAMSGQMGPLAKKQAMFKKNVLTGRKKG